MQLTVISLNVVETIIENPGMMYIHPNNTSAMCVIEDNMYVLAGDFTDVKTPEDINTVIKQLLETMQ